MKTARVATLTLLVVLSTVALVRAKGATTKIRVESATLSTTLELSDSHLLEPFNIWSGPGTFSNGVEGVEGFIIDWAAGPVDAPPSHLPRYQISFFVRHANRPASGPQTDDLSYVVSYVVDTASGRAFVYLPGKDDDHYRLNTTSIHRGIEGHWFRTTDAWRHVMQTILDRAAR